MVNPEEAARLRKEYEAEGLVEGDMTQDPFDQFQIWFSGVLAVGIEEPMPSCSPPRTKRAIRRRGGC